MSPIFLNCIYPFFFHLLDFLVCFCPLTSNGFSKQSVFMLLKVIELTSMLELSRAILNHQTTIWLKCIVTHHSLFWTRKHENLFLRLLTYPQITLCLFFLIRLFSMFVDNGWAFHEYSYHYIHLSACCDVNSSFVSVFYTVREAS